jgi:hypothetical protein
MYVKEYTYSTKGRLRVVNPDTDRDPVPVFQVNPDSDTVPDQDPGFFDDQKLKKKNKGTAENFFYLVWSKIAIYVFLGLHKGRPGYRRSLQPSKENIQYRYCVIFALLDPDTDPGTLLNPDPIRIRIHNCLKQPDPQHCLKQSHNGANSYSL